jgi:hypothetical protein
MLVLLFTTTILLLRPTIVTKLGTTATATTILLRAEKIYKDIEVLSARWFSNK